MANSSSPDRTVITIVGGGAYSPRLCDALARTVRIPEGEVRLSARRAARLRILADHSARRLARTRPGWCVRAASSLDVALEGASIVVLLARVGGLEARAWDEAFPRPFGLVGDEGLGPGGIANAWRTMPELLSMARTIRAIAPNAHVINLMAPLGITTRLLLEQGLDAVGVCELPQVTLETWLARTAVSQAGATWHYGGLNHLGWFWDIRSGDVDVLQSLASAPAIAGDATPVDGATFRRYRAAPLRYFYEVFDRAAAETLGLRRRPNRAAELIALSDTLLQQFAAFPGDECPEAVTRPTPWLDRVVAPIAAALLDGSACSGFVNVRNGDTILELPSEIVVEVAATITASGIYPVSASPLPDEVACFLRQVGESENLAFEGARQRDPGLLALAIRALPLSIPEDVVHELATLARRAS